MSRILSIPLALLVMLAGAMVWSGGAARRAADFTYIEGNDIGTLDLRGMSWAHDLRLAYALWEGLYTLDAKTLRPVPGSAGRIDVNEDKTIYTFHLRPEAKWSSGDAVEAGDFVFSWKRSLEEPGVYTHLLFYVKGAKEYQEAFLDGKRPQFGQVGVEVLDPRTLRVTLKHPVVFFPDLCAFPVYFPQHRKSMAPFADPADRVTGRVTYRPGFTRPPNLVGNGPYRLAEWEFKRVLRLEASEHYWDRRNVKSRVVEQVHSSDSQWAFLQYDSGRAHWLSSLENSLAAELRRTGRKDLHIFPGFGTEFYSINCRPRLPDGRENPFADARVRRAFSMAIRKEPIVENITRLGQSVARTFVPPGIFEGYRSPEGLPFDPAGARRLLAEAGYGPSRPFPRFTLIYNKEGGMREETAQHVRRQWLENLGVAVDLEAMEVKIYRNRLHNRAYTIARASWIGDYNDVSTFTDKYQSFSDNNDAGWENAEYDRLCAQAAREPDAAKRLAMLARAEAILCEEAPIIPLYYHVNTYLFRQNVRGVEMDARMSVMMGGVEVRGNDEIRMPSEGRMPKSE